MTDMSGSKYVQVNCDWGLWSGEEPRCNRSVRFGVRGITETRRLAKGTGWVYSMGRDYCSIHAAERLIRLSADAEVQLDAIEWSQR